jgi:hypothetical protein
MQKSELLLRSSWLQEGEQGASQDNLLEQEGDTK